MLRSFLTLITLQLLNCRPGNSQADRSEAVKLRLVNGQSRCAGRVEIHYKGQWGTVYDYFWDQPDAGVVCGELGCGTALSAPRGAHFGEGSGPIVTSDVECKGNETALRDCRSVTWGDYRQYGFSHSSDAGVICSGSHELRLVGGKDRCSGRVEVLRGDHWGTLCDVYFRFEDASVICEHLQCGVVEKIPRGAAFGKGNGPVWKENYRCHGSESRLWECPVSSVEEFNCSHENDASVICSEHKQLRLSDGGSRCAGRLEIYYKGTWGSVCDDSWDLTDADVACKQLSCGHALRLPLPTSAGTDADPIWLNELQCSGNESLLWECPHALWGNHDCNHKEDVNIMCSDHKELRLAKGVHRCEGRVEVFYNGTWGTICSDKLGGKDAAVICKQSDCGIPDLIDYGSRRFGVGSGPIWLENVECLSHESTLWQCKADPWGQHSCAHGDDAGVICSGGDTPKQEQDSANGCKRESGQSLRLAGGNSNCSGRVEIFCNRAWGTVCDDSWGMNDASVVCRQLGCGSALMASGGAAFGQGNGPVWLDDVRCAGSESILFDCPSSSLAQADCDHKEDASVICSGPDLSPTSPPTPSGHEDGNTSIPLVICISLSVLLICELIALLAVMLRRSSIKDPHSALYQAIYEEIDIVPSEKLYTQSRVSVSSSIDSSNQIEYYASHRLGVTDPGSEYPEVESSSIQAPALTDYDDAETETIDSQRGHLLLNHGPDGIFALTCSSGDLGTLGHSHQHIQDVTSSDI
ncbi:scavenger receptor cysteine-rich domain-containing protein DMBT1-like isoform X2 [Mustelus asterias]